MEAENCPFGQIFNLRNFSCRFWTIFQLLCGFSRNTQENMHHIHVYPAHSAYLCNFMHHEQSKNTQNLQICPLGTKLS